MLWLEHGLAESAVPEMSDFVHFARSAEPDARLFLGHRSICAMCTRSGGEERAIVFPTCNERLLVLAFADATFGALFAQCLCDMYDRGHSADVW